MSPAAALTLLFVAAIGSGVAIRWRGALVMSLPFFGIFNGMAIPLAGSSVHIDQLVGCLLLVPLAASALTRTRRIRMDSTVCWLAAILVLNVLVSVLHSPTKSYSLMQCVNLASAWLIYPVLLNYLDTRESVEAFVRRLLWAAIIGCGIGICAFLSAIAGFHLGGAEVSKGAAERLTNAYGAFGTMVEPNIFGSFSAANLVLAFTLLAAARRLHFPPTLIRLLRWTIGFTSIALVFSFTRAAWLAALVGLFWMGVFGRQAFGMRIRLGRIVAPVGVGVLLVAVMVALPGETSTLLRFKLLNLVNLGSETALVRLMTYGMALQQTIVHPIIGWGTFTFAPLAAEGIDFQQFDNWRHLWIGNYLLLALHDIGVVGLALWLGLLGSVIRRAARAVRIFAPSDAAGAAGVVALSAAVVTLLISFLSTTGFSLGFSWMLLGALGAYCRLGPAVEMPPFAEAADAATGRETDDADEMHSPEPPLPAGV